MMEHPWSVQVAKLMEAKVALDLMSESADGADGTNFDVAVVSGELSLVCPQIGQEKVAFGESGESDEFSSCPWRKEIEESINHMIDRGGERRQKAKLAKVNLREERE